MRAIKAMAVAVTLVVAATACGPDDGRSEPTTDTKARACSYECLPFTIHTPVVVGNRTVDCVWADKNDTRSGFSCNWEGFNNGS